MYKLSICIPTYSNLSYVSRVLESLKKQTVKDFEVVITDDSSNDSVEKTVNTFSENLLIKYYKNETPLGPPANWNRAMSLAKGEYLWLLHYDDWLSDPTAVEQILDSVKLWNMPDLIVLKSTNISEKDQSTRANILSKSDIERYKKNPEKIFPNNYLGPPSVMVLRKKIWKPFQDKYKYVVDLDWYINLFLNCESVKLVENSLVNVNCEALEQLTSAFSGNRKVELFEWSSLFTTLYKKFRFKFPQKLFIIKLFIRLKTYSIRDLYSVGLNTEEVKVLKNYTLIALIITKCLSFVGWRRKN